MIDWIISNCKDTSTTELAFKFNAEFLLKVSPDQMRTFLKNRKIKTGYTRGKGYYLSYTDEQAQWIIKTYRLLTIKQMTQAFNIQFGTDKTEGSMRAFTKNHKIKSGRNGQFTKGGTSWNKGKHYMPGGNSVKTRFKKGSVPHNTKQLGHERIGTDGYTLISIDEVNPHTGFTRRYVHKHRYVWQQANGPIPPNQCIKFLDGNRLNCDLSNLMLIDRATNLALVRRGYDTSPSEIKPTILAISKLQTAAKKKHQE